MNPLLYLGQDTTARASATRNESDWSRAPASGAGRLVAAFAIIGMAVLLLELGAMRAAHGSGISIASTSPSSQERK